MGFAPVFNIPLISDIFFLIFALKKDCNKIFILLQPLSLIYLTLHFSLFTARSASYSKPSAAVPVVRKGASRNSFIMPKYH